MSAADKLKCWAAGLIAAAGVYMSTLQLVGSPVPLRFLVFFASVAAACGLMYLTVAGREFIAYAQASAVELRKVVWPGREEVVKMSGVVILFVFVVALFLWLVDALLSWLLSFLAL